MPTLPLYVITLFIWSSTWLAIQYQLGEVPITWSIAYRFALSGIILVAISYFYHGSMKFNWQTQRLVLLQGLTMFSANYLFYYWGSIYLNSGLVAVLFASILLFNIIHSRIFLQITISPRTVIGALIGLSGLVVVFGSEIFAAETNRDFYIGTLLCLTGTIIASLGSIVATKVQRANLAIVPSTALAMVYGTIFMIIAALSLGHPLQFSWHFDYVTSLLYLVILGSVLAFLAYLNLIKKIGPNKAAYVFVLIPVIAMLLSTVFEGFTWHPATIIGLIFILAGNMLVLKSK